MAFLKIFRLRGSKRVLVGGRKKEINKYKVDFEVISSFRTQKRSRGKILAPLRCDRQSQVILDNTGAAQCQNRGVADAVI